MQDPQVAARTTSLSSEPMSLEALSYSVAKRARIVFVVALGFYLYALSLAASLLVLAWLAFNLAAVVDLPQSRGLVVCAMLPVTLYCSGSALLIVWSLIPRRDRFTAPGKKIDLSKQPRLLEIASGTARDAKQTMPHDAYVTLDVNAAVTEHGGIFGMRKRTLLILGLPLLSMLNVNQFRAVLAHELGHLYWGDTRLGPWLRRTWEAIHATIETLEQAQYTAWLNLLLFGYAEWFFDISFDLFRRQEFLADRLSAKVAGPRATTEALQLLHVGDDVFDAYWRGTIAPVLKFGVRLPISEGFRRFLAVQNLTLSVQRKSDLHMKEDKTEQYDTHPALPDRVAALAGLATESNESENNLACVALLDNLEELEADLLSKMLGKDKANKLTFVTWEDALYKAYLPMWENTVRSYAGGLDGLRVEELPDVVQNLTIFGMQLLKKSNRSAELDSLPERTGTIIGSALALALHRRGWELRISPGEPVRAFCGRAAIEPFDVLGKLVARKLSADEWRSRCVEAGIENLDLGKVLH